MSNVVDLAAERVRRRGGRTAAMAAHPSGFPRETDLQPFLDTVDRNIKELCALVYPQLAPLRPQPHGSSPIHITFDETHHFTKNNSAWDNLMADILTRGAATDLTAREYLNHWTDVTPERREEVTRVLSTLRSTDQGSDGGDTEGCQGDDRGA